jgi:hypothetical protein
MYAHAEDRVSVLEFGALGVMEHGKVKLFDQRAFVLGVQRTFGDGVEVEVVVKELGRKRTSAQNRFFYGPVLKAFEDLGYHKQEAHDLLCLRFIPKEIKTLDGFIIRVPGHTSELKVDEFNDFIEQCIQLAAENDLVIQDSDQWRQSQQRTA